MSETYNLLFFLSGDITEELIEAMESLVDELADDDWLLGEPEFVDEVDFESVTQPEDEPIRTVGGVLTLYRPSDPPDLQVERTHHREVKRVVDAIVDFTASTGTEVELELGGELIGDIIAGKVSSSIEKGLLEEWSRYVEKA